MKHSEKVAPFAAIVSALATLGCCLPFGIAGLLGTAGLTMAVTLRPWLLALAAILLSVGFVHLRMRRKACDCGKGSMILLCLSAAIVAVLAIFPDRVALLASRLP